MLTESCVVFFSPSRAVLSAILREEYLTSLVLTAEDNFFKFSQSRRRDSRSQAENVREFSSCARIRLLDCSRNAGDNARE